MLLDSRPQPSFSPNLFERVEDNARCESGAFLGSHRFGDFSRALAILTLADEAVDLAAHRRSGVAPRRPNPRYSEAHRSGGVVQLIGEVRHDQLRSARS